jgi:hypothetical protein
MLGLFEVYPIAGFMTEDVVASLMTYQSSSFPMFYVLKV